MTEQVYCVLDFETKSKIPLPETGAYEYANHASTKVLCVAWRIGTFEELRKNKTKTRVWSPFFPAPYGELKRALLDPKILLVAHNAFFEQVITRFVLSKIIHEPYLKEIPPERWICTASMAAALAFPRKLVDACLALALPVQKDMEGHKLMLKLSKPRLPRKAEVVAEFMSGEIGRVYWHKKKKDLLRLMEYCGTDVDAEVALFTSIPKLSPAEREIWLLDQKINWRGFLADRPLVLKTLGMIETEIKRFGRETTALTSGVIRSTGQRDATLGWLREQGLHLPNLQKKTVEDALQAGLATGKALTLLELRQNATKTSTAKYEAFEMRSRTDGRVRDNLVYHAASTGRWSGSGVQPQNFPARGTVADTDYAADLLSDPETDLDLISTLWGNPLDFFSSLLRSMIKASPGKELFGGDFAGIEVRVLFWVARHERGLHAFREGRDLYCEIAKEIYGYEVTKKKNPKERDVGKRAILGCGFGMGADKFFETCKAQGQEVERDLAAAAVQAYRSVHYPVKTLWSNLERAAIAAVENPGKKYTINRTSWYMSGKYLFCELPSGRKLSYYDPSIRLRATSWGEMKPTLHHWDVHPKTRKWVLNGTYGGKLTENVVQAIARDLMAASMLRAEKLGYNLLITVHDELLTERKTGEGSIAEFEKMMRLAPDWAAGLPVDVEAWSGPRYRK